GWPRAGAGRGRPGPPGLRMAKVPFEFLSLATAVFPPTKRSRSPPQALSPGAAEQGKAAASKRPGAGHGTAPRSARAPVGSSARDRTCPTIEPDLAALGREATAEGGVSALSALRTSAWARRSR